MRCFFLGALLSCLVFPVLAIGQDKLVAPADACQPEIEARQSCVESKLKNSVEALSCQPCALAREEASKQAWESRFCSNPSAWACRQHENGSRIFDSNCNSLYSGKSFLCAPMHLADSSAEAGTPSEVALRVLLKKCEGSAEENAKCETKLKFRYARQISNERHALIYTPPRKKWLQALFGRAQSLLSARVSQSLSHLPPGQKKSLLASISRAKLVLDDPKECPVGCFSRPTSGAQPEQESYYLASEAGSGVSPDPFQGLQDPGTGKICLCSGYVAQLENMSDESLLMILGHELGHSIDPCHAEQAFLARKNQVEARAQDWCPKQIAESGKTVTAWKACLQEGILSPEQRWAIQDLISASDPVHEPLRGIGERLYGPFLQCLRGSSGQGCASDAANVVKCGAIPTPPDATAEVRDQYAAHRNSACNGLAGTERVVGAQPDQINEAFADFSASMIIADYLKQKRKFPDRGVGQSLVQMKLPVVDSCSKAFAPKRAGDVHPPAGVRLNYTFFSNPELREAVGCSHRPRLPVESPDQPHDCALPR